MREDLIKSAESFLSSANVQSADKDKKVQFLKKKSLNDEEIEEAFKRVGGDTSKTTASNTITHQPVNNVTATPKLPPRPASITQIVYYPPAPIPRMTTKQLLSYAIIIGFGTFGITVTLTTIIKKFMSKIFNSIANYQGDRYQQNTKLLKRAEDTIQDFTTASTQDTSLQSEQIKLNESLDRLIQLAQLVKEDRAKEKPYKVLQSNVERFRNTMVQNPFTTNNFDHHMYSSNTSGLTNSFANRYQVENNNSAAIQNIKSEIRSFKGMLLSRRNFPIVAATPPVIPPPIRQPTIPNNITPAASPATPTAPIEQTMYHPRRRRSYRSELATNTQQKPTTVEEVKDSA